MQRVIVGAPPWFLVRVYCHCRTGENANIRFEMESNRSSGVVPYVNILQLGDVIRILKEIKTLCAEICHRRGSPARRDCG